MADNKRVKMTLMLDSDTIDFLKSFAYQEVGDTNVSKAVRLLAKKHGKKKTESEE
jgi:hypothetical protein